MSGTGIQQYGEVHTALTEHVADCDACRSQPPACAPVTAALHRDTAELDATALSWRTLVRLRPELERRAAAVWRRRVLSGVLVALVPLPLVLAYDTYVLRTIYGFASAVLPAAFATYLVASYAAMLVLMFAATYAAIPVLLAGQAARRAVL